jgi:hypothetical protein
MCKLLLSALANDNGYVLCELWSTSSCMGGWIESAEGGDWYVGDGARVVGMPKE